MSFECFGVSTMLPRFSVIPCFFYQTYTFCPSRCFQKPITWARQDRCILISRQKAKINCKAYEAAPKKKPGRDRPTKKGKTIYLKGLFDSCRPLFRESTLVLYRKKEQVGYYCVNLLWRQKLYQELRFVLNTVEQKAF